MNKHQVQHARRREELLSSGPYLNCEVRFVYEQEVRGEWISVQIPVTMELPLVPAEDRRVIRVEFRVLREGE